MAAAVTDASIYKLMGSHAVAVAHLTSSTYFLSASDNLQLHHFHGFAGASRDTRCCDFLVGKIYCALIAKL